MRFAITEARDDGGLHFTAGGSMPGVTNALRRGEGVPAGALAALVAFCDAVTAAAAGYA